MNDSEPTRAAPTQTKRNVYLRRFLMIAVALGVVLFGAMFLAMSQMGQNIPADLDTSSSKRSENGLYTVTYQPSEEPIPIGDLQTWRLEVMTPEGEKVQDATITLNGDMPGHGHGLPTSPIVTAQEDGSYLVEGLKFQMGGWWYTTFTINSALGEDTVRFDFVLQR